jgi:hypothetical protein
MECQKGELGQFAAVLKTLPLLESCARNAISPDSLREDSAGKVHQCVLLALCFPRDVKKRLPAA